MFSRFAKFVRAAVGSKRKEILALASKDGIASNSVSPMEKKLPIAEALTAN